MSDNEATIWGIHAGEMGEEDAFFKKGYIALGWRAMGDLGNLKASKDAFKAKVAECYPDAKPGAIPNNAGQLLRFVHEMKPGDIIAYPSRQDRQIHIGRVEGSYKYAPDLNEDYPNLRPVKWIRALPRTNFTQGALYEIGSAMSLFQIKTYAEEFRAALEGKSAPPPVAKDDTVAPVVENIEENTRDFILKHLAQDLKGHPLAEFAGHLLNVMGYRTRVSQAGPDGGVDIIAHKDELGFEPPIIKVQVKSSDSSVGEPAVAQLYGTLANGESGLFVTLGTFTAQARTFAKGKSNLRLIDGIGLVELILEHYEQLDSRYKGLFPLKRVYVAEALPESL